MPHHKMGTSKTLDYVCHTLLSVHSQLLSWPLHPGYWMSCSMNCCLLWQLEQQMPLTSGVWWHPRDVHVVGLLCPALHPGYCCTQGVFVVQQWCMPCFFWSTRVQRVLGGVYMAHSMTSTSGGMGHTPTKVCLRWHIVATVMRYVDNNTMHLWQCPEPAVMLFQGTVENNLSLCGCARVLVSCSIRLQCS